ncbi:MAG: hypothetical protein ACKVP7_09640 [Hyphomicrobiaceae bacterium]
MRVVFHIGAGKTGTSAIQVALAQNRHVLAAAGVHFPEMPDGVDDRAARGAISSGNARALAWLCNPKLPGRGFTREGVLRWVEQCIAGAQGRHLLFSSEAMQSCQPDETREMLHLFQQAGYTPEVVFYVRHALDHAIAEYLQHVKMGFATLASRDSVDSLDSFLLQHRCRFLRSLNAFSATLPKDAIHVRLYDAERTSLVPGFLSILGLALPLVGAASGPVVNRSPTPDELPLLEALARQHDGTRLCRALSDLMLNAPAASDKPFTIAPDVFERFSRHNQSVVDEINSNWLGSLDKLLIMSPRLRIGTPEPIPLDQASRHFAGITALVLRELLRRSGRDGTFTRANKLR